MDLNTLLQCFWVLFVLSVPFTTYSGFDEYLFRSSPYTGLVLGRDFQNVFFPHVLTGQVPVTPLRWIVFDLASFFLLPVNLLTFLAIPSAFACLKKSSIFPQKVCLPPPPPAPDSAHRHDRRLEGVAVHPGSAHLSGIVSAGAVSTATSSSSPGFSPAVSALAPTSGSLFPFPSPTLHVQP